MTTKTIELARAICDHFVTFQTSYGRPDPKRTAFATGEPWSALVGPTTLHSPPFCALTLYQAGRQFQHEKYIEAADRFTLYLLSTIRDPFKGKNDHYSEEAARFIEKETGRVDRSQINYLMCRSWMCGIGLDVLCRGFMAAHPTETGLHSKAAALFDWLQEFRTDRGPYFRIGYMPCGLSGPTVDGAFSDDLGLVGRGLASYYAVTRRDDVLEDLAGLAGYYLCEHMENRDDGCFWKAFGSWVICPWPLEIEGEHIQGQARADRIGWGFSNREAVDFLSRFYGWVTDDAVKTQIRRRVVSGMKWVFDACQHETGAVGMFGRDDGFIGMAGAGILNFLDCRRAGLLDEGEEKVYGLKVKKTMEWILSWTPERIIDKAGHEKINGGVRLHPPENLAWMLAWTADALLRSEEL